MEDKLDERMKHSFRWRPETAVSRKWEDLQGRFGPEGEPPSHSMLAMLTVAGSNRMMDFNDIKEWTDVPAKS